MLYTPLCDDRSSGIYILTGFSEKTSPRRQIPGCPFLSGRCFAFFKYTQTIYAGHVKVALGKQQTDQIKLKISPGTGEAKSSLGEEKKSTGSGFTGSYRAGRYVGRL